VVKNGLTTGAITLDATSGNISGSNLSVTGKSVLGAVGNVTITGGSSGYVLSTDGSGNLSFIDPTAGSSNPAPMPIIINAGNTLTISANYQGLFGYPLTIDGTLDVEGILIDVNDNGNGGGGGTATALNANIANVSISGGTSGYYLQTDGAGTLSWAAGGGGGSGSPGGVTTQVQFNDAGSFAGNSGFTFNKTTGTLSATYLSGAGNALSNIQGANVSGAVSLATYATTANSVAGANVSGTVANATYATTSGTSGTVTTAAQPNITSTGTLTTLTVSGNTDLGAVGNVKITGGNSTQVLSTDGAGNLSWVDQSGGGGGITTGKSIAMAMIFGF